MRRILALAALVIAVAACAPGAPARSGAPSQAAGTNNPPANPSASATPIYGY